MSRPCLILSTLLVASTLSSAALAQDHNKFAIGANFTLRGGDGATSHRASGTGVQWRFGHDKEGWGWQYGLNWYSLDVDRPVGGSTMDFGELRMRPLMGGYGYTHVMGRTSINVGALAGYSFNSVTMTRAATDAYRDRLGAPINDVHLSTAPVVKPEVNLWRDINRKIGLNVNVGYIFARPQMTLTSALGKEVQRFRADAPSVTVGVVYKIF